MKIDLNKYYILNPYYGLVKDINRIILLNINYIRTPPLYKRSFNYFVHPIHAMMLSFFNGNKILKEVLDEISEFFSISFIEAQVLLEKFIENKEDLVIKYENDYFYFPKFTLIENIENKWNNYKPADFALYGKLDFSSKRLSKPTSILLMLNSTCKTDCVYCYIDKNKITDCKIPTKRILELIDEAKNLSVAHFDLAGGEVMMHKDWQTIIEHLYKNNYSPYLTTKIPLREYEVETLKKIGVQSFQISLDSIYQEDLEFNIKKGKDYFEHIKKTISYFTKYDIELYIKGVITAKTFDLQKIEEYLDFLNQYENIKIVELTPARYSGFNDNFFDYRITLKQVRELTDKCNEWALKYNFILTIDNIGMLKEEHQNAEEFTKRGMCTANVSQCMILPNGDVTMCERAQWHEPLILGSVVNNSIQEVWNSDKARKMFFLDQSQISTKSACSTCNFFDTCRQEQGVCWVAVIDNYGVENWDFPDPRCPLAPNTNKVLYFE